MLAANKLFADRACPAGHAEESRRFSELVDVGEDGLFHLPAEGEAGVALRAVHIPVDPAQPSGTGTFLLFDGSEASSGSANLQALLEMLPIGLALVDRDGRFLTMNQAFRNAGGHQGQCEAGLSRRPGRQGGQGRGRRRGSPQCARAGDVRATLPSASLVSRRAGRADHRRACAGSAMPRCCCCSRTIARKPSSSGRSRRRPRCRRSASSPAASRTTSTTS